MLGLIRAGAVDPVEKQAKSGRSGLCARPNSLFAIYG